MLTVMVGAVKVMVDKRNLDQFASCLTACVTKPADGASVNLSLIASISIRVFI